MLEGILLIVIGILAMPSLLLSKKPNAKELLDKIVPYQGFIGVAVFFYGIFNLIFGLIPSIGYLSYGIMGILFWVLFLALVVVQLSLGFIMGYGLIAKYALSKNEAAKAKGEEILAKIAPLQGKLGIAAIVIAIAYIVLYFLVVAAAAAVAVA